MRKGECLYVVCACVLCVCVVACACVDHLARPHEVQRSLSPHPALVISSGCQNWTFHSHPLSPPAPHPAPPLFVAVADGHPPPQHVNQQCLRAKEA